MNRTIRVLPSGDADFTRDDMLIDLLHGAGELQMERLSEIRFSPPLDGMDDPFFWIEWKVDLMCRAFSSYDIACVSQALAYEVDIRHVDREWMDFQYVLTFPTYEAARELEIKLVDAMRESGVVFMPFVNKPIHGPSAD